MEGQAAIERNVEALRRILLSLVVMAGEGPLPRHLHRAILRLLRPAEVAARRLIIALALGAREKGDIVAVPPWRGPVRKVELRRRRHFQPKMPPQPKVRPRPAKACPAALRPADAPVPPRGRAAGRHAPPVGVRYGDAAAAAAGPAGAG